MLCKLSLKNIKKSFKDYLIYFATLILGVAIFYMFNSVGAQKEYMKISESSKLILEVLVIVVNALSVFVAFILGILIVYANRFLMKRRNKEFAIYLTLGMSKKKISKLLLFETVIVGVISLSVGVLVGTGLSQIMNLVVIKMFEADVSDYRFTFSMDVLGKTALYFSIIYVVVMLFNVIIVGKCKLIDLINSNKKVEKIRNKNVVVSTIVFIISIILLVVAYKMVLGKSAVEYLGKAVLLGCVGTFLFFWSVSGFLLRIFMSMKKVYYKSLNSFLLRQISSKINTEVFSLTVICLLLFFTICIINTSLALNNSFNEQLRNGTKVDVQVTKDHIFAEPDDINAVYPARRDIEKIYEINMDEYFGEYCDVNVYHINGITQKTTAPGEENSKLQYCYYDDDRYEEVIKLSDYNKILKIYGEQQVTLKDDEYMVISNDDEAIKIRDKHLKKGIELSVGNFVLKPKYDKCKFGDWKIGMAVMNMGTFIVPDVVVHNYRLKTAYSTVLANYAETSEEGKRKVEKKLTDIVKKKYEEFQKEDNENIYASFVTKISTYDGVKGMGVMGIFIGLYLGVVFLISCVAILALKSLSESIDNKQRYSILRKIGADEKMINSVLVKQIGISFIMPLALACVHSYFGNKFAGKILGAYKVNGDIKAITITALIIAIIYGGYFALTFLSGKNIVNEKN